MVDALSRQLVSNELWELIEPLLPESNPRPQGGGVAPVDQRAVFIRAGQRLCLADAAAVRSG
ncbi:hypothetical protein ACQPZ2_01965 [Nocardia pseudovaccinii]|uniref:hypothetical protein n=1 Tax=Nocardia pseudovaccinii TaxID=189540 RepID=UPI003D947F0E